MQVDCWKPSKQKLCQIQMNCNKDKQLLCRSSMRLQNDETFPMEKLYEMLQVQQLLTPIQIL